MELERPRPISERLGGIRGIPGYDHNFVVNGNVGELRPAARMYDPASGRVMEIHTTQPGIQFYDGNLLAGTITGKGGKVYVKHYGFCLETQHFPDSPEPVEFPLDGAAARRGVPGSDGTSVLDAQILRNVGVEEESMTEGPYLMGIDYGTGGVPGLRQSRDER